MAARFDAFETMKEGTPRVVHVRVRDDVTLDAHDALVRALDAIPWSRLQHAYGNASDVPCHLYAITVGHGRAREAAWWELWGNIHHQGTVYEATVHAVRFIGSIAGDADHPDRVQALCFLREIAAGSGSLAPAVSAAVRPVAEALLQGSPNEPELVQRAMLWLLAAFPSLLSEHEDLLRLVPDAMRGTWEDVLASLGRRGDDRAYDDADDNAFDRQHEFEAWALAGWVEPAGRRIALGDAATFMATAPDDLRSLLPLLERPREESGLDDGTAQRLVAYGATAWSDWWAGKALDWVDGGVWGAGVAEALRRTAQNKTYSQETRSRAWRYVRDQR